MTILPSTIDGYLDHYATGATVTDVVGSIRAAVEHLDDPALFIGELAPDLDHRAASLDATVDRDHLPLFGIPFVVKDNIDVAGMPTTAACPAFAYLPDGSADAVQHLVDAGAVVVGKVNLDQFATGLVGTRSPHGSPRNVLDVDVVPGGSSSGSAVAVAAGIVPIALGTDTAGSGRVPAAMNQIIGLKPTRGTVSTAGVVPACASLDCVSVFAATVTDAWRVLTQITDPADDPWQRADRPGRPLVRPDRLRVGVPGIAELGVEPRIVESFHASIDALTDCGASVVDVDLTPFLEAGRRLYGGPFVAERYASVGAFIAEHRHDVVEPTRTIILGGADHDAASYHEVQRTMHELRRETETTWLEIDVLAVPTVPDVPSIADVIADPIATNSRLGVFTTFANLLDLTAITLPDHRPDHRAPGMGVTLYAQAGADARVASLAATILREAAPAADAPDCTDIVVAGAHLEGLLLNHQLIERGARLVTQTVTAPRYRLWALPDERRPALEHVGSGGRSIEVEVWSMPTAELGGFVAGIAPPLGMGTIELADGSRRSGFICELGGLAGATDITSTGGWRAHLDARQAPRLVIEGQAGTAARRVP